MAKIIRENSVWFPVEVIDTGIPLAAGILTFLGLPQAVRYQAPAAAALVEELSAPAAALVAEELPAPVEEAPAAAPSLVEAPHLPE